MFGNKEPKYKIYPVQKENDHVIEFGLFVYDDKYGGHNLKFAFETEQAAYDFISELEQYPKYYTESGERTLA